MRKLFAFLVLILGIANAWAQNTTEPSILNLGRVPSTSQNQPIVGPASGSNPVAWTGTAFTNGTYTWTFPSVTSTLPSLGAIQTWTAAQTFTNSDLLLLGSSTGATTFASANSSATNYTITFPAATGTVALTSGAAVASVSNSDGTLAISPTTGSVVASLALGHANTWTAAQTFTNSDISLLGSSTGYTTFTSANSSTNNYTLTIPAATGTVALTSGVPTYTSSTSWTPAITATTTAGTPAYTTQVGSYEKLCPSGSSTGCSVTVRFSLVLSGWTGSPSGSVEITGLPVASSNTSSDDGSCLISYYAVSDLTSADAGVTGLITPNTTVIQLFENALAGSASINPSITGTTPTFVGWCSYHT